jgi:hypothetical protein
MNICLVVGKEKNLVVDEETPLLISAEYQL